MSLVRIVTVRSRMLLQSEPKPRKVGVSRARFLPWIGERYAIGCWSRKRLLVLGESHYQWDESISIDDRPTLTLECIEEQISGAGRLAFWTHIAVTFLNRLPTIEEKHTFWHSVAFYNYVQFGVGAGPRVRPTEQMWRQSEAAFAEVFESQKPDVIIVLGYTLWNNLPELNGVSGPVISGADQTETWRYPHSRGDALAYGILHPSSGRFSGYRWHPYVHRAIELA